MTQEIDLDALEAVEEFPPRKEVTQEIELGMVEEVEALSTGEAVAKLESQAAAAEQASTEELFRRAPGLDGVDPRLVRAAHTLESDRRGGRSRKAAELLKEKSENLEGINPRFLRAAARLEEARINEVPAAEEEAEAEAEAVEEAEVVPEEPVEEDDWREKMSKLSEDSVISFIAPPTLDQPADVRGFPRNQQRKSTARPPSKPKPPPPPPRPPKGRS